MKHSGVALAFAGYVLALATPTSAFWASAPLIGLGLGLLLCVIAEGGSAAQ